MRRVVRFQLDRQRKVEKAHQDAASKDIRTRMANGTTGLTSDWADGGGIDRLQAEVESNRVTHQAAKVAAEAEELHEENAAIDLAVRKNLKSSFARRKSGPMVLFLRGLNLSDETRHLALWEVADRPLLYHTQEKAPVRILYIAGAVVAPGSHGGATHVLEVASELSKLGHELHVVCRREKDQPARLTLPVEGGLPIEFYRVRLPQYLNLLSYPWLVRLAKALKPDLVMERYYNLAGAGMIYARRHGLPSILEVNALMVDPPGTRKFLVDSLLFRRLEWWATLQCHWAGRIVTPLHTTVPKAIDRAKIAELPWGANTERFNPEKIDPEKQLRLRFQLGPARTEQRGAGGGLCREFSPLARRGCPGRGRSPPDCEGRQPLFSAAGRRAGRRTVAGKSGGLRAGKTHHPDRENQARPDAGLSFPGRLRSGPF